MFTSCAYSRNKAPSFSYWMLNVLEQLQSDRPSSTRIYYLYDLIQHRTIYTTDSVASLLGYDAADMEKFGLDGFAYLIHPDDLERVAAHYEQFYTLRYGEVIEIEYRMKHMNGTWSRLRSQETALMSQEHEASSTQVLGMIQDLTQPAICSDQSVRSRFSVLHFPSV